MKKNNKKDPVGKPKINSKVGLFSLLMFLQTIIAFAGEAKVLRQMDGLPDDEGHIDTNILLDSNNDNRVDMSIRLGSTNVYLFFMLLKEYLQPDSVITYNDDAVGRSGGLSSIRWQDILTIDGEDILDLFPEASQYFRAAAARRAAQQERGR